MKNSFSNVDGIMMQVGQFGGVLRREASFYKCIDQARFGLLFFKKGKMEKSQQLLCRENGYTMAHHPSLAQSNYGGYNVVAKIPIERVIRLRMERSFF